MSKKQNILPQEVNKMLRESSTSPTSYFRDEDGVKKKRAVEAVVNAFSKKRTLVNNSVSDFNYTTDVYNSENGSQPVPRHDASVADLLRSRCGKFWTQSPDGKRLVYVEDETPVVAPYSFSFSPLGGTAAEVTKDFMSKTGAVPPSSFLPAFEEAFLIRANDSCRVYDAGSNVVDIFSALISGGKIREREMKPALKENQWYEDLSFSVSLPYSLRDIERFTTSTNTMYASIKPTYNFFIPGYESAIAADTVPEPMLPNLYVITSELVREGQEPNPWFVKHITLNGGLRLENNSSLLLPHNLREKWDMKKTPVGQYFDMFSRQYNAALTPQAEAELASKFSNLYISHSNVELLKDYNSRKELFPMFVDMEFSTDTTTEFAEVLKESALSSLFMKDLTVDTYYNGGQRKVFKEHVETAVQASSGETNTNEIAVKSELLNTRRRVFDLTSWYNNFVDPSGNRNAPTGFFDEPNSIFLGKQDAQTEVTNDPKYNFYRSLMSVIFSSKVRDLARARTRTFEEIMNGKLAHTETVLYRIEKRRGGAGGTVVQNYWLPNSNEIDVHKFIDTQVKYGRTYTYTIYAYELVFGSKYMYKNTWVGTGEAGGVVRTEPLMKVVEVPYYTYTNRLLDSPPVMPDVEIIPYRGVNDKVKINFSGNVGRYDLQPEIISSSENRINSIIRSAQDRLPSEPIRYESDDHSSEFEIFRMETQPFSYKDFAGKMVRKVLTDVDTETEQKATSASYVDSLDPNKKYWYTFRSVDNHGHVSYPTPIYQVEMVDDQGAVYPVIKVVDFAERTPKVSAKVLKRMMQIVPTFGHGILNEEKSGLTGASSVADRWDKDTIFLGVEDESLWGKKFKIRLTSRKTGRKVDVNVVFEHKHQKIKPEMG